jgi:hypothetical protein
MGEVEVPNLQELKEMRDDRFTKGVALVTAVFAVALAITSLGGSNAMKEMLLSQQKASDQWAFYQAKVMREHHYKTQKSVIEALLLERGDAMKPEAKANYETLAKKMGDDATRYATEKKEIETAAKALEATRDLNQRKDPYFDYAEVLLQISIVMASISIVASSRPVFGFACLMAVAGSVLSFNGYFLVFAMRFIE